MAEFSILDFGAVGDNTTDSTDAINSTIEKASSEGGGTVLIPDGAFRSGTIFLKDNVRLDLSHAARIVGSEDITRYPLRPFSTIRSYTERYTKRSLIFAEGARNIRITGSGIIDGNGGSEGLKNLPKGEHRPVGIRLVSCSDVTVADVHFRRAGLWMQHYCNCEDLHIHGIRVFNHGNRTNDGMNIDGCRKVRISDCFIDSHDDSIVIKSTGAHVCEDVLISNCVANSHCHGIKFGTESQGGYRRITLNNIIVHPSDVPHPGFPDRPFAPVISGFALELVDGGIMEDIVLNNITAKSVFAPMFIKLGNRARKIGPEFPDLPAGSARNLTVSNFTATDAGSYGGSITGFPGHYIENVTLSNIRVSHKGGIGSEKVMAEVPENETGYPEIKMFGNKGESGPCLPAYGLYVRHVKNISLRDVKFDLAAPDARAPVFFDDVHDISMGGVFYPEKSVSGRLQSVNSTFVEDRK